MKLAFFVLNYGGFDFGLIEAISVINVVQAHSKRLHWLPMDNFWIRQNENWIVCEDLLLEQIILWDINCGSSWSKDLFDFRVFWDDFDLIRAKTGLYSILIFNFIVILDQNRDLRQRWLIWRNALTLKSPFTRFIKNRFHFRRIRHRWWDIDIGFEVLGIFLRHEVRIMIMMLFLFDALFTQISKPIPIFRYFYILIDQFFSILVLSISFVVELLQIICVFRIITISFLSIFIFQLFIFHKVYFQIFYIILGD